jgi:hypothetical protein
VQLAPEDAHEDDDQRAGAGDERQREDGVVVRQHELALERAGDRREQVDVDERPGEREEDLLHDRPAEHAREVGAGDDRHEHQQHHERADVGRKEAVESDAGRIGGEHLPVGHRRARERLAEDEVPAQRRERRLERLEREAGDEVPEPDPREGVPHAREPAGHVDAEQLERRDPQGDPRQPGQHLDQPPPT